MKDELSNCVKSICIGFLLIGLTTSVCAHSGRTDAYGGHHDYIHGGYHYHSHPKGYKSESPSYEKSYQSRSQRNEEEAVTYTRVRENLFIRWIALIGVFYYGGAAIYFLYTLLAGIVNLFTKKKGTIYKSALVKKQSGAIDVQLKKVNTPSRITTTFKKWIGDPLARHLGITILSITIIIAYFSPYPYHMERDAVSNDSRHDIEGRFNDRDNSSPAKGENGNKLLNQETETGIAQEQILFNSPVVQDLSDESILRNCFGAFIETSNTSYFNKQEFSIPRELDIFSERYLVAKVIARKVYSRGSVESAIIVIASAPLMNDCPACGFIVGIIELEKREYGWVVMSRNLFVDNIGNYGSATVSFHEIKHDLYAVAFHYGRMAQGEIYTIISMYSMIDSSIVNIFNDYEEYDSSGSESTNPEVYRSEFSWIKEAVLTGIFDMKVVQHYTTPEVRTVETTYSFDGQKYVRK